MSKLFFITMILTTLSLPACKGQEINWPQAVACAVPEGALVDRITAILRSDGTSDKLSPESVEQLKAVGVQFGFQAASCAIAWAVDQLANIPSTSSDRQAELPAVLRGRAFMAKEGIR